STFDNYKSALKLIKYFERYGELIEVKFYKDPITHARTGMGNITYRMPAELNAAIKEKNHKIPGIETGNPEVNVESEISEIR
ncbi:hypothetical protein BB560_006557, partial [Smittium megazygosporum]